MRPRKHKLVLSLDNLRALMIPGKTYTAAMLSNIFDGSAEAIGGLLETLMTDGLASTMREPRQGEQRRIYWLVDRCFVAERRIGPAEVAGELRYDILSHQRLCNEMRKP